MLTLHLFVIEPTQYHLIITSEDRECILLLLNSDYYVTKNFKLD